MHTNWMLPAPGTEGGIDAAPTLFEIWLLPGAFFLIGLALWIIGSRMVKNGGKGTLKWVALISLFIAIVIAFGPFYRTLSDPSYVEDVLQKSRKLMWGGLYAAFLLPLTVMLGCIGWTIYDKRMGAYR